MSGFLVDTFLKDPGATLDYGRDWSEWLVGEDGTGTDTIAESEWTVPAGLTHVSEDDTHTDTKTTVWVSGGTAGVRYTLTNRVTTTEGRIDERDICIVVRER